MPLGDIFLHRTSHQQGQSVKKMLRTMLQTRRIPYVCSRCSSRIHQRYGARALIRGATGPSSTAAYLSTTSCSRAERPTAAASPSRRLAQARPPPKLPTSDDGRTAEYPRPLPIRERLRLWAAENEEILREFELTDHNDSSLSGKAPNSLSRPQTTASPDVENLGTAAVGMSGSPEERAMTQLDFEVGVDSRQPGDLVELRAPGARSPIFAVYLGFFGGRNHFYGSQGRWLMSTGYGPLFTVANFASAAEIRPVLDEMPRCRTVEDFDRAQQEDRGPSRAAASALLDKMARFKKDSQSVYLGNMGTLDRARILLSDRDTVKYMSLFEIADVLLPSSVKRGGGGGGKDANFPASALYAVHTALYRDEIAFRPLSPTSDCHRRDHMFEVFPLTFVESIGRVAAMVRGYWVSAGQMSDPSADKALRRTLLGSFVDKARQVVLSNRQRRGWDRGAIAPLDEATIVPEVEWSHASWEIISYLQWWASYDLFEPSSRFSSYGSVILRALDLYDGVRLDQSTAWTLLRELGVVPLWEVPSRYRVRFPGTAIVRGGGLSRSADPDVQGSTRPDIAAGYRVDRADQKVFCIDGPDAVLIDDGISLERTDGDDEFWIHVHAADPASGIRPDSPLTRYMELIPQNIYLQGHFQAMLSDPSGGGVTGGDMADLVRKYSLAPGAPALTFSARVNRSGDILDHKIQPTTIHDVVYLDPRDVADFCNQPAPPARQTPSDELSVGRPPGDGDGDGDEDHRPEPRPNRPMTKAADLDEASKEMLSTLYTLSAALGQKRRERGAWPHFFPGSSVQVSYPDGGSGSGSGSVAAAAGWVPADPHITVSREEDRTCSVVDNLMVLAGQVAARWCSDRRIPVPFRRDTKSATNYEAALRYATSTVYPQIARGVEPSRDQRMQLAALTGGTELSTSPGPYFILGLDMYAKATSPLRRFSDLLLHWQVHAALNQQQHRRGTSKSRVSTTTSSPTTTTTATTTATTSTTPTSDSDPGVDLDLDLDLSHLPFSEEEMSRILSLLHMREKMASTVSRGDRDWILMALARTWRFGGDGGSAPAKFRFTVTSRRKQGLLGQIDFFGLDAMLDVDGIDGLVLLRDVEVGHVFDVEIDHVDVYAGEIRVKAIGIGTGS
ncbi:Exoribonuclease R [Geosmithia morbida]|uniref:Exoribonuclease R n=1 Tax=Geosmithia morbida TaxID=1094350 RepID=A0A9P4YVM1_9HYPO|nr:Exoribonuclease R [Geosmithia morbida]KAF4122632.1 Exoribonuclease R [Geosmithia morbida]